MTEAALIGTAPVFPDAPVMAEDPPASHGLARAIDIQCAIVFARVRQGVGSHRLPSRRDLLHGLRATDAEGLTASPWRSSPRMSSTDSAAHRPIRCRRLNIASSLESSPTQHMGREPRQQGQQGKPAQAPSRTLASDREPIPDVLTECRAGRAMGEGWAFNREEHRNPCHPAEGPATHGRVIRMT